MLKDPLQTNLLPHELFHVDADCTDRKAIDKGYMDALLRKEAPANVLNLARKNLLDPTLRMEHEMLLYRPESFDRVSPSPIDDPTVLELKNRAETAKAWQIHLRKSGPNIWLAHALGVLWYWWAVHDQEIVTQEAADTASENGQSTRLTRRMNALHNRWLNVIGYWGMVSSTPQFWSELESASDAPIADLQDKFVSKLQSLFRDLGQNNSAVKAIETNSDLHKRFRSLEDTFLTERTTSREVGELKLVKLGYAGPVLLKQIRVFDGVYRKITEKIDRLNETTEQLSDELKRNPENQAAVNQLRKEKNFLARLIRLRKLLSVLQLIETLLQENRTEEALDFFATLPDDERESDEAACLLARARYERGRQLAELKKYDEALAMWREARSHRRNKTTDQQIVQDVVSTCLTAVAKLGGKQLDKEIDILEQGLKIVKGDEKLKAGLSNRLTRRGIETINAAQENVDDDPDVASSQIQEILVAFDKGIADLERAADLGSKNAKAQLDTAHEQLGRLQARPYFMRGVDIIERAKKEVRLSKRLTSQTEAEIERGISELEEASKLGSQEAQEQAERAREWLKNAKDIPAWAKAAQNNDWDRAITLLREAINTADVPVADEVKTNLGVCLANRAMHRLQESVKSNAKSREKFLQKLSIRDFSRRDDVCAGCDSDVHELREKNVDVYTCAIDGNTVTLCDKCRKTVEYYNNLTTIEPSDADVLKSENDLLEAVQLCPYDEDIECQLDQVQQMAAKISPEMREFINTWEFGVGKRSRKTLNWKSLKIPDWLKGLLPHVIVFGLFPSCVGGVFAFFGLFLESGPSWPLFYKGFGCMYVVYLVLSLFSNSE